MKILIGSETSKKVKFVEKLDWQWFYQQAIKLKTIGIDIRFRQYAFACDGSSE